MQIRTVSLSAAVVVALLALVASASATTITSPTGSSYTGEIKATTEGHAKLANPITTLECHSSLAGKVGSHGKGVTAKGNLTSILWGTSGNLNGTCTNSWHVTTMAAGSLEIHWTADHEGTLTSTGFHFVGTRFGISCAYETNATHLGTFTDSHRTGTTASPTTATFHINDGIPVDASESSGLCGSGPALWQGSYKVETPDLLYIDKE